MDDFLCIGAGLAGLACAADLTDAGARVTVLDKGRALGGRAATRTLDGARIDHGAQFFTARDPRFEALVAAGIADGWVRVWSHGFPLWQAGRILARPDGHPRYTCPDGIRALPERLGAGLTVHTGATVAALEREGAGFVARTTDGERYAGARLILNLPPAQLLALAGALLSPEARTRLEATALEPAWALLGTLESDIDADWPALEFDGHAVLAWVARDHTRRAPGAPPALTVHARGDWSAARLDHDPAAVQAALEEALAETIGPVRFRQTRLHRWRWARPTAALDAPYLDGGGVFGCGDWCEGARVEGAILSGWALAKSLKSTV